MIRRESPNKQTNQKKDPLLIKSSSCRSKTRSAWPTLSRRRRAYRLDTSTSWRPLKPTKTLTMISGAQGRLRARRHIFRQDRSISTRPIYRGYLCCIAWQGRVFNLGDIVVLRHFTVKNLGEWVGGGGGCFVHRMSIDMKCSHGAAGVGNKHVNMDRLPPNVCLFRQ